MTRKILIFVFFFCVIFISRSETYREVVVDSKITAVQPMTGIVFWEDNADYNTTDAIQLEFSYMRYSDVVSQKGVYNWTAVDNVLASIASRGHQAILRFRYEYPGEAGGVTAVPAYIKVMSGYQEEYKNTEDGKCYYADWRSSELQAFTKEFFTKFAERYENDARLAFLQVGFGHWSEYHIYGGPTLNLGKNFPSKAYQDEFLRHLAATFVNIPWSVSIDAADATYTPIAANSELKNLKYGLFDDSFMSQEHESYNKYNWETFGTERYKISPAGGEFSYYTTYDQKNVLNTSGIYGVTYEQAAGQYHISYMIGNDQPEYQPMSRIKEAGLVSGYKFKLDKFLVSENSSIVTISNFGVAPIYYDAYVTVNGVRATNSLKGLAPGESKDFEVASGGDTPVLTIESDRLLASQKIQYKGNVPVQTNTVDSTALRISCMYPLPAEDILIIKLPVDVPIYANVKIVDALGQVVLTNKLYAATDELNVSSLWSGCYYVSVQVNGRTYKGKIIKK